MRGGGVYDYGGEGEGRGAPAFGGGFGGGGFALAAAFGGVVEVGGGGDEVFDFGADDGLRAEDEACLGILEDTLDELAEVEVGAVVGVDFSWWGLVGMGGRGGEDARSSRSRI